MRSIAQKSWQTLLHGFTVTSEIKGAPRDPDQTERRGGNVTEVNCAKPQRCEKYRHPFERVHVNAKDAFEVRIAARRRQLDVEFAVRHRNASRKKEIKRDGKQRDDSCVIRHDDILC